MFKKICILWHFYTRNIASLCQLDYATAIHPSFGQIKSVFERVKSEDQKSIFHLSYAVNYMLLKWVSHLCMHKFVLEYMHIHDIHDTYTHGLASMQASSDANF